MVACGFLSKQTATFLITFYLSKYVKMKLLNNIIAQTVIIVMKFICTTHRITEEHRKDESPPFNCDLMRNCFQKNGALYQTISLSKSK